MYRNQKAKAYTPRATKVIREFPVVKAPVKFESKQQTLTWEFKADDRYEF